MNALGIDWGEKRIGLAFADTLLGVAFPIKPAIQSKFKDRLAYIENSILERSIKLIVIGYPINMDGTKGFMAEKVDAFILQLEKRFRLPVHRVDERLTSHNVKQDLMAFNQKINLKSGDVDSRAACILLQDFLNQNKNL